MEDTEARTAEFTILATRLYADGILVKETADQGVWCAVLNTIIAAQLAVETERQSPVTASRPADSDDTAIIEAATDHGSEL